MAGAATVIRLLALSLGAAELPALAASLVFAVMNVAWYKASHADVHALSLFFILLTLLAIMRFAQSDRFDALLWGALAFGMRLATQLRQLPRGEVAPHEQSIAVPAGLEDVVAVHDVRERGKRFISALHTAVISPRVRAGIEEPLSGFASYPRRSGLESSRRLDCSTGNVAKRS